MRINRAIHSAAFQSSIIACALTCSSTPALALGWKGVTPLHATQAQVKTRLGKPSYETADRMEFNRPDGKAVIFFYTEADTKNLSLAPSLAGKVLTVYFYPAKPRKYDLAALKGKTRSVGRGATSDGDVMTSYDDGERGVSYHFKKNETSIWRIVYYAPRAEFARFNLKGSAK